MKKLHLLLFISLFSFTLFSQLKKADAESIADCSGAINIFRSGNYSLQFTGSLGNYAELINYPSLTDVSDENLVWVSFIPEYDGTLSFEASLDQDFLQMVVFEEMKSNICLELANGAAEIMRIHKEKGQKIVGLNREISTGMLYPLELVAGQKIVIAFSTVEKSKAILNLNFHFEEKESGASVENNTKIIDERKDEFAPTFSIMVRDSETNSPIIANVTIEGSKELMALYKGSDFLFNVTRAATISIRCDAEGYFFVDKEMDIIAAMNKEIVLKMDRVAKGKSFQIEQIEFKPGSSEFMTGSEPKLRRLKDFMALNADINVEIQGHVFSTGNNNIGAQKMSEARAKRVMIYLIDNGIAKDRMEAVGYGNSRPIYPEAKMAYEEQANRRVEILVK